MGLGFDFVLGVMLCLCVVELVSVVYVLWMIVGLFGIGLPLGRRGVRVWIECFDCWCVMVLLGDLGLVGFV